MATIVCRSPQEIHDDRLVEFHADVSAMLDACLLPGGLLYTGKVRAALAEIQGWAESAIVSGAHFDSLYARRRLAYVLSPEFGG